MSHDELKAGTKVLVEAIVRDSTMHNGGVMVWVGNTIVMGVRTEHIHPFPGVQEWKLPASIEGTVYFEATTKDGESWVFADEFPVAKCISHDVAELFAAFLNSITPPPPSSAEQGEG